MQNGSLNKAKIFEDLRLHKDVLDKYGVKQIGLFGSFVRDEGKEDSDVDFLVDFEPGMKTFDNVMELSFFLNDLFQRKVEIVTRIGLSPYIGPHILKTIEYVPLTG
ncbi:MAG: nucleotidyltransferase family protein [Chitinophagaceae bacterium]